MHLLEKADPIWGLKEGIRSPSDWAEPAAALARLAATVDTSGTIVQRPPGTRRRKADQGLLPSAVFQQLIDVRDSVSAFMPCRGLLAAAAESATG
jgi:hypothetical protein